jgi:hypothetical protein
MKATRNTATGYVELIQLLSMDTTVYREIRFASYFSNRQALTPRSLERSNYLSHDQSEREMESEQRAILPGISRRYHKIAGHLALRDGD